MKNLLKSTLYLAVFAIAGILFQISCSADSTSTTSTPVGKIIYTKKFGTQVEIWTCDYDGTNQVQVPIALPPNVSLNFFFSAESSFNRDESHVKLSPDGQTIFFETVYDPWGAGRSFSIYSCDISGSNVTEVVSGGSNDAPINLGGAS